MSGKSISTAEAAGRLGVTDARIRTLCGQRRIAGARRVGRQWFVPEQFVVTPGARGPKPKAKR
jgi:hypothetical protein